MDTKQATTKYRLNQWSALIHECRSSGLTIRNWCKENGISEAGYYYWLKRVRAAACEALPSQTDSVQIVPLNIPTSVTKTYSTTTEKSSCAISIQFGSVTVELHNSASSTLIENTFIALQKTMVNTHVG